MIRTAKTLIVTLILAAATASCSKSEKEKAEAPPAPAMPAAWEVKSDVTYDHDDGTFLETEGRLEGKLSALRVTTYEVEGHAVQLKTLKPKSSLEGDKIFRILANKKKPGSYLRKGEILYEFAGPVEAAEEIESAREMLSR